MLRRIGPRTPLLLAFAAALGCGGELRTDDDRVCVVPSDCSECGEDDIACSDQCSEGEYSADTPLRVVLEIIADPSELSDVECSVEQTGEFELTVSATWREKDKFDNAPTTSFECDQTPALAAGTWTINYGEHSEELEIPSVDAPITCVSGID